MYTPKGSFEGQRYSEIYGFKPNATRRDLRRQGRQFKRYLKTDAAEYDRQMFEQAEQARREGELRARTENLNKKLAAGMRTPMQIDTSGAMERMNAGFEASDSRRTALAEEDLKNRIAGAARFNDAFRMARQAGLKTFTWRGNLYGTKLAPTGSGVQDPRRTMHNAMDANPGDFVPGKGGVPSSREQVVGGYGDTKTKEQRFSSLQYFQQGGAMQGDIMSQVQALVQAAAQGDEQATQQITQIMEAAKSGNQQAIQIAQMIQQVIEQMQGQATAAKWGAKLGYIRSLKYGNGGKTCPACKKGGIPESSDKAYIKSTKKVEEKACGGKSKKKYFGGLI